MIIRSSLRESLHFLDEDYSAHILEGNLWVIDKEERKTAMVISPPFILEYNG